MSGKWKEVVRLIFKDKRHRALQAEALKLTTYETHYDKSARPIEDLLQELAKEVPKEEWKNLPSDLNDNLDHYLYGVPKQ